MHLDEKTFTYLMFTDSSPKLPSKAQKEESYNLHNTASRSYNLHHEVHKYAPGLHHGLPSGIV